MVQLESRYATIRSEEGSGMLTVPKLRELRQRRVMSQRDLAQRAGVAVNTIIHLESGGTARYVTVRKLAEALDVPAEELVKED